MVFLRVLENTLGRITLILREILNKGIEMDMEFGKMLKILNNNTKAIICLTKNMDLEFTTGEMGIYIKEISSKICVLDRVRWYIVKNQFIMGFGVMDKNVME
jgi:hypothetical protein